MKERHKPTITQFEFYVKVTGPEQRSCERPLRRDHNFLHTNHAFDRRTSFLDVQGGTASLVPKWRIGLVLPYGHFPARRHLVIFDRRE